MPSPTHSMYMYVWQDNCFRTHLVTSICALGFQHTKTNYMYIMCQIFVLKIVFN